MADRAIKRSTKRTKLLIVSSYHRPCGIAQYLEHLEPALRSEADFDIEIAALPVDLLRAQSSYARKAAKIAVEKIARQAAASDVVNIQFEPGLFGQTPVAIWERLSTILKASQKVIVTYHTAPKMNRVRLVPTVKGMLQFLRARSGQYVFNRLFAKVRANPTKFFHIVQTAREAETFKMLGILPETIDYRPLSFLGEEIRNDFAEQRENIRKAIFSELSFSGKIIGCFGFLSPYKGFEVAIKALKYLSDDHHLLIVGGLHPEGLEGGQHYLQTLLAQLTSSSEEKVKAASLWKRVHFCGALNNEDFNRVMAACDAVVLPYAEVGQTSSGPASIALDMQLPLYCSHNHCFRELDRFQPGMLSFFEISNYLELAEKLVHADGARADRVEARRHYLQRYNVQTRAQAYVRAFATLHPVLV
jgi:glycosyltransferase involved in cell wall biosynthesis